MTKERKRYGANRRFRRFDCDCDRFIGVRNRSKEDIWIKFNVRVKGKGIRLKKGETYELPRDSLITRLYVLIGMYMEVCLFHVADGTHDGVRNIMLVPKGSL